MLLGRRRRNRRIGERSMGFILRRKMDTGFPGQRRYGSDPSKDVKRRGIV
jgi:hypothetical protein